MEREEHIYLVGCSAHIVNRHQPDDFQVVNLLGVLRGFGRFIGQVLN